MRLSVGAVLLVLWICVPARVAAAPPDGYQQILPRGKIASIDAPRWVDARTARLSDDAIVYGIVIEGEARAFSLNLLNSHEVVNDRIGDTPYAAVW